jgi:PAS domain S-box-containing protein
MIHEKGVLLKANDQYFKMFGYEPHDLLGKRVLPLTVVPESLNFRTRRTTPDGVTTYEIKGQRKDGSTFLMEVRGKLMEYQGRQVRGVAVMDISERKKIEEALRESEHMLRFLSTRLLEAGDKERSRISKELHDQLGHDLALLKSRVHSIGKQLEECQENLQNECENMIGAIELIIENVRRISRDLMPSILEDLGLFASLQWLVENFSKQHGIHITLDMEDIDHLFSREIQVNIYRVFQESFTNISKHADAKEVSIEVKKEGDGISFVVKDDGKGFELNKIINRKFNEKGVGLMAMKERMNIVGGTFEVNSLPGKGTIIKFVVPIEKKEVQNGK